MIFGVWKEARNFWLAYNSLIGIMQVHTKNLPEIKREDDKHLQDTSVEEWFPGERYSTDMHMIKTSKKHCETNCRQECQRRSSSSRYHRDLLTS